MTKLPFIVTHDGKSVQFFLHIDKAKRPRLIEMGASPAGSISSYDFAVKLRERVILLNDLLHAEVPFAALASCRHSPGLNGAILDPAATALEQVSDALTAAGVET